MNSAIFNYYPLCQVALHLPIHIVLLIKFATPALTLGVKKTLKDKTQKHKTNPVALPLHSKILSLNLIFSHAADYRVQYRFIDG